MPTFDNLINRYDTRTLLDVVTYQEPKPSMFRNSFFNGPDVYFSTKWAEWDEVREGASMARYVGDKLEVDATEFEPFITKQIETPRFQEKRSLDLTVFTTRAPGENIYSQRTPADRAREKEQGAIEFCMDACDRRVEQQCSSLMTTGRVDILGKGVDVYVDYDLPLKLTLAPSDQWGAPGIRPFKDLIEWATKLRKRNYNPDMLLMELSVADIFMNDPDYRAMLDNTRMEMGRIAPGPVNDLFQTAQYFGQIKWPGLGVLDLYTYAGTYKKEVKDPITGVITYEEAPYLDEGRVLMLTPEARRNRILYGAETIVMEGSEEVVTVEGRYVPEIYTDRRAKTKTYMVTQRAMPAPFKDDSWWTVKVLGS